ncbi:MAG TPA: hemerythrin domain-containing protein [Usitatibacter sp.]|nr:hemerythrin domain-containing protein [Usitatibacter sp.]
MQSAGFFPPADIRDQLRKDHEDVLAELEALRADGGAQSLPLLARLRRSWVIHALAEETVVYRALEGLEGDARKRADERFVEHELVEGLFDKLSRSRPASSEWVARLGVARELIMRHIETEHEDLFSQLAERYDPAALAEMGEQFASARDKLTLLEEAKAA